MTTNKLYAFDFDGVICDSAVETGLAGWQVAQDLWSDMPAAMPDSIQQLFREVRPVMETGYEAILIVRLLFENVSSDDLLNHFPSYLNKLKRRDELEEATLKQLFGETRDTWIQQDLDHWVSINPLFAGFVEKFAQIDSQHCVIITTKQERFVDHILKANQIMFPVEHIYGLDRQLSKQQILADLTDEHPDMDILFVEDRLPTLFNIINDGRLDHVQLFFANWGYNTTRDKLDANQTARIELLDLAQLAQL